jgi:hypothetical protein
MWENLGLLELLQLLNQNAKITAGRQSKEN